MTYHAFISYQRDSAREARRVERDLYAIAKRHPEGAGFRLFLDTSELRPGTLTSEINDALERSRFLIVLLDRHTPQSRWVADEITHWLAHGGSVDRLVLVKVHDDVDLRWDGGFVTPQAVPEPLRDLFKQEQKWVAYTGSPWRERDALVPTCARLMGAQPSEYLVVEARYQRRRLRLVGAVAVAMAVLLVAALVAALLAVANQREAERNAAEARAQADAAEAVLTASAAPALAIERALRAARDSASPTVRSAMLAVSQASARLERALPHPPGTALTDLRFSADGSELIAWGPSVVHLWNAATGDAEPAVPVTWDEPREVVRVGPDHLAACTRAGPVLVALPGGATTHLGRGSCQLHEFGLGVVLLADQAHVVDRQGAVTAVAGIDRVVAHPESHSVGLSGPAGAFVAGPHGVRAVPAGTVEFADAAGAFAVRVGPGRWHVDTPGGGRDVAVPPDAVDVAPLFGYGDMTGDFAWITINGTVGWTRDDRVATVPPGPARQGKPYDTTLEPLTGDAFAVVHGSTAAVVHAPNAYRAAWEVTVEALPAGTAGDDGGTDPVIARCAARAAVVVAVDESLGTGVLLDDKPHTTLLRNGRLAPSCQALDVSGTLTFHGIDGEQVLRPSLQADAVAVSHDGSRVALLNSGLPVEVLSTRPVGSLPEPWDVNTVDKHTITAFGERELSVERYRLVIADGAGVAGRLTVPEFTDMVAPRPDGTGGVLSDRPGAPLIIADGAGTREAVSRCTDQAVEYLPGPGFRESIAAAEAQVPAANGVDCRDGAPVEPADVVSYDVGGTVGRIITKDGDTLHVTTWTRGDPSSLTTIEAPRDEPGSTVSFDPSASLALTYRPNGHGLGLHRRDGDTWTPVLTTSTGITGLISAQLVDGGSLVLAVGETGVFELFDTATGRLVAFDHTPSFLEGRLEVGRVTSRRVGDRLQVLLDNTAPDQPSPVIGIPVGIPALRRQLCSVYQASSC